MQIKIEGNKITLNDLVTIEYDGENYLVNSLDVPAQKHVEYDPVYYTNGNNGFTVEDSAKRAARNVYKQLYPYEYVERIHTFAEIYRTCKNKIINGDGRQSCYALAGAVKKEIDGGKFIGLHRSTVFALAAEGRIELSA